MALKRCSFKLHGLCVEMHTFLEEDSQVYMLIYGLMNRLYGCLPSDFKDCLIEPDDPDALEGFSVIFTDFKSLEDLKVGF